jgi:hypothetical protein
MITTPPNVRPPDTKVADRLHRERRATRLALWAHGLRTVIDATMHCYPWAPDHAGKTLV